MFRLTNDYRNELINKYKHGINNDKYYMVKAIPFKDGAKITTGYHIRRRPIQYDDSLEGVVLPTIPLTTDADRTISQRAKRIKRKMREFLTKMRFRQEVEYAPGNPIDDQAFINSLLILRQWYLPGIQNPNDLKAADGHSYHVKGTRSWMSTIQTSNIIIWAEDDSGVKTYHNFKKLCSKERIVNIFKVLTGQELIGDDYQGLTNYDIAGRNLVKVGVSFFSKQDRKLRKIPEKDIEGDELDIEVRNYTKHAGGFFPFVPLIPVDLTKYGVFNEIKKKNYKDNCFIYACIQSGVFTPEEIDTLRSFVRTREIPRAKITEIANLIKCNFIIRNLNEHIENSKHRTKDTLYTKTKYDRTVDMVLFRDHYLINDTEFITPFYIEHYEDIVKTFPMLPLSEQQKLVNLKGRKTESKTGYKISEILMNMVKFNRFRPIYKCESELITTTEYDNANLMDYVDLNYNESLCCREIKDDKKEKDYSHIIYADFESDITQNPHKAYLCCCVWRDSKGKGMKRVFTGYHCATEFLDFIPDKALIYFHNLKYDASFFINMCIGAYAVNMIEHTGKMMMLKFRQIKGGNKQFTIKDSYSIISAPLRAFGSMFNLEVHKEVCPYHVYNAKNISKRFVPLDECLADIPDEDKDEFVSNCKTINCLHPSSQAEYSVQIIEYAVFYCVKDCTVLMLGMEKFNDDLAQIFASNNKPWIGTRNYLSISAIGYDFTIKYGCLDGVYALAGKPQDFISRCVSGGRTMCAENRKQLIEKRLQDFDAVSLYPSAMSIMPGVAKGKPKVITDLSRENVMKYDDFYVEINITKLTPKGVSHYRFPLLFEYQGQTKMFVDKCIQHFYIDKRGLMDLEQFYDIEYEILRGYYFDEGFNNKINDLIKILFDLRAKYKKEGNPLQQTIKLLLNSIYGKSILKPIKTDTKIIDPDKIEHFINLNYNFIKEIHQISGKKAYAKMIKPINNHFNVPHFGEAVCSWSKHIMNEVMCLADQKGIKVYYQDTDSLHIGEEDVPKLQAYFKEAYGRELIGKNLCQFHCDFDPIKDGIPVHSRKLIALGKKCYVDMLEDDEGNTGYHIRMKGIPQQVIIREAEKRGMTIEELYMYLYNGNEVKFNLLDGSNCFRKNKCYEMETPLAFSRKVSFE